MSPDLSNSSPKRPLTPKIGGTRIFISPLDTFKIGRIRISQSPPELGDLGGNRLERRQIGLQCSASILARSHFQYISSQGSPLLAGMKIKGKPKKSSSGQMRLFWDNQKVMESTEVEEVAKIFIEANCYNPPVPGIGSIEY
ncbi:MAG: hypothetical protein QNJ36_17280 [Calothrix sp. MO_167.B42]|nr:hypothetical protein [Calothrix sp. MO_167.B42]